MTLALALPLAALPLGALPGPPGAGPAPSYLSPTGAEIVLALLGVVAVASALLVVTTRQLVHAALWLVVTLGAIAGSYLVLTAEFIAWVQVLVYVGAVVVLLLFGLMLTRAPIGASPDLDTRNRPLAAAAALATAAALVALVVDALRSAYVDLSVAPTGGSAEATGAALFRTWVLPFEVLSVLLLAALVGAIVLSRSPADQARDLEAPTGPAGDTRPPSRFGGAG